MFCRWTCGCIGIEQFGSVFAKAIVIQPCDADNEVSVDALCWSRRDMADKTVEPLDEESEEHLHRQMAARMAKADRFDAVRHALGIREEL